MIRVEGYGSASAQLMIVGIAPGAEEELQGRPFVGPSGHLLDEDLREAGSVPIYKTNVFKYRLPDNEFRRYQEIGLSLPLALEELRQEIHDIDPNCILGLGDPVLATLAGKSGKHNNIGVWRGSIIPILGNRKAIFTWHPSAQLHGEGAEGGNWKPWQKYVRKFDIKRAVEQSWSKDFPYPNRLLHIANNSSDVYRYIERNLEARREYCAVDIEAIEGIPVCIGLSFDLSEAISIPLWNLLEIDSVNYVKPKKSYKNRVEVSTIPDDDLAYIWQMLAHFFQNRRVKFIGQNFKYDENKLNRLGFYLHSLYADTLISGHNISTELPKSLAFQTSINTLEPYYKDEGRNFIPGKDSIRDLLLYNCKDACCTLEIFLKHLEDMKEIPGCFEGFIDFRMKLHKTYLDMEQVGFATDNDKRLVLIKKYVTELVLIEREIFNICQDYGYDSPINVNAWQQVDRLIYENMRIPRRKGTGEEVLTALMANVVKDKTKKRALELILKWRQVSKTLGTYLAAQNDYDGRMKTTYFITGTESYRTSTQVLKEPLRPTWKNGTKSEGEIGWALQTVTKHGDTGSDLRSILVADKGYVFINIDQSQAEARVCSLLADDEETLQLYDTNDIHALTASKIFGGIETTWSKRVLGYECPERFCGKTARHAYHLNITKRELMTNMNTDARKYKISLNISEWKAGQILEALAKMTPKIQEVFHAGIQECLSQDRRLFGTYGASFYLYEDWGRDLFKAAYSRIPQQTVSDKSKKVAIWVREHIWDCKTVGEAHDALLFLCPERKVDEYVPLIKEQFHLPISFAECSLPRRDLVIPCDVEVGYDYENLEKYKLGKVA